MNFYFSLIMERSATEAGPLKVYSFSTFFFPKLRGGGGGQAGGHATVKRWTKAVDLFLFDLILVPLHLGIHWAMAVSYSWEISNCGFWCSQRLRLSYINHFCHFFVGDRFEIKDGEILWFDGPKTWWHLWTFAVSLLLFFLFCVSLLTLLYECSRSANFPGTTLKRSTEQKKAESLTAPNGLLGAWMLLWVKLLKDTFDT